MLQQIIALIIISYFLSRLVWQKQKKRISGNEFIFWLLFWFLAAAAIIFIRQIDALVAALGFGSSGIEALLYLGVAWLFYLVFRLRIKAEKTDRQITRLTREIAEKNTDKEI